MLNHNRNKRKSQFIYFIVILITFIYVIDKAHAQAPTWLWAKAIGGTGFHDCYGYSICTDAFGNVFTTGYFQGNIDLDPSNGVFNLTSAGGYDIFISKLDALGNFVWGKTIGGTADDIGNSIKADTVGNLYLTGTFKSPSITFGSTALTNADGVFNTEDIFITKLDTSGNFIWAKSIGWTLNEGASSIALDAFDNVYTTGYFAGTIDFDPGPAIYNLTGTIGKYNIFVSKLDSSGNFVWAKSMGGTDNDFSHSITIDRIGNVYFTGNFSGTTDFDPGLGLYNLTSIGNENIFVSKLDSSGNFVWANAMIGTGNSQGQSIAVDADANVYSSGNFTDTTDFDPGIGIFNLTGHGQSYISKLDSSGNFIWAKAMRGTGYSGSFSITVDPTGSWGVYFTGSFSGTVDFNPGPGIFNLTSPVNFTSIFVSKIDSSGNFIWAKAIGGAGSDIGLSLALDAFHNLYLTGWFYDPTINFDHISLTNTGNTSAAFIAKLDFAVGLNEIKQTGDISIFPNPTNENFYIFITDKHQKITISILDITGKIIYENSFQLAQKIEIISKGFSDGLYFVQIKSADLFVVKKLVIVK